MPEFVFLKTCTQDWSAMAGGKRARFCGECDKTVHNLSSLTRKQAEKLVSSSNGSICGRLAYDGDEPTFRSDSSPFRRLAQISALSAATVATSGAQSGPRSCQVRVEVTDQTAAGIAGARVEFLDAVSKVSMNVAQTKSDGNATATLATGKYFLNVQSPGFAVFNQEVEADCLGAVQNVEVILKIGASMGEVVVIDPNQKKPSPWQQAKFKVWRLFHPYSWH